MNSTIMGHCLVSTNADDLTGTLNVFSSFFVSNKGGCILYFVFISCLFISTSELQSVKNPGHCSQELYSRCCNKLSNVFKEFFHSILPCSFCVQCSSHGSDISRRCSFHITTTEPDACNIPVLYGFCSNTDPILVLDKLPDLFVNTDSFSWPSGFFKIIYSILGFQCI